MFLAVAEPAFAQTPCFRRHGFRQTVVVTAAARPVELGSVTRLMTIITREQIARLPVESVADVLRLASSVDVRVRGVRGVQTDFAVRGANFGQMLVLVDGVRLNDAQSGSQWRHSGAARRRGADRSPARSRLASLAPTRSAALST